MHRFTELWKKYGGNICINQIYYIVILTAHYYYLLY